MKEMDEEVLRGRPSSHSDDKWTTFRVRKKPFKFRRKYFEGHVCTAAEAAALAGLAAENVRNNLDKKIMAKLDENNSPEMLLELQEMVMCYGETYDFRAPNMSVRLSPLEVRIEYLAKVYTEARGFVEGTEEYREEFRKWKNDFGILQRAHEELEAEAKVALETLRGF